MRIPFLSDPSVYAEDHLGRVFRVWKQIYELTFGVLKAMGRK